MKLEEFGDRVLDLDTVHLLVDFDRTLTLDGPNKASIISLLRSELSSALPSYKKKALELKEKYIGYENNPDLDLEVRLKMLEQWWCEHFELMIAEGLTEDLVNECIDNHEFKFRDGFKELNEFVKDAEVPLAIMSAGVGNMIKRVLQNQGFWHEGIHIISNEMIFDKNGLMVSYHKPVIHTLNKKEKIIEGDLSKILANRKNVILMGDSLGDADMAEGFPYENICKIAFKRYETSDEVAKAYRNTFDEVWSYDASMENILSCLQSIN
jgi:5'-nucleotidase